MELTRNISGEIDRTARAVFILLRRRLRPFAIRGFSSVSLVRLFSGSFTVYARLSLRCVIGF